MHHHLHQNQLHVSHEPNHEALVTQNMIYVDSHAIGFKIILMRQNTTHQYTGESYKVKTYQKSLYIVCRPVDFTIDDME